MALVTMKTLLEQAEKNHRGIGAFSVGNMEMVKGAVQAGGAEYTNHSADCRSSAKLLSAGTYGTNDGAGRQGSKGGYCGSP